MKSAGVYRILCRANGRNYVGSSSKDWKNRRNGHLHLLKKGKHPSKRLQEDWKKFGGNAFEFICICECSPETAIALEKAACEEFKAFHPDTGYNTMPISDYRFNAGRKKGAGFITFSARVSAKMAKKLGDLLELGENADFMIVRHRDERKFVRAGEDGGPQRVSGGLSGIPPQTDEDILKLFRNGPLGVRLDNGAVFENRQLKRRVEELEKRIRELEESPF